MKTTKQVITQPENHGFTFPGKMIPGKSKQLFFSLLLFASLNHTAQSGLTNLSFETWTTTPFGPAPTGWLGINASHQTTGAQQGNSYVRLSNTGNGQGTIILGSVTLFTYIKGGVPLNQTPPQISGFYKTSGMNPGDSVGLIGMTSKAGAIKGFAQFFVTANKPGWTSFSIPFTVFSPGDVDSLFIVGSSSKMSNGPANSPFTIFDLDNLSLSIVSGIEKNSLGTSFLIYPNPASDELTIISKDEQAVSVRISGMDGKPVEELPLDMEKTKIDLRNYPAGVYFYSILNKERKILLTNKLLVTK